jgi:N-acetylglutamate synthase-like GNAT family acetyltransferase
MQVRDVATSDLDAVHRLLSTNGWAHRIGDVERLGRLISASQRAVVAVVDGEIVGFARAITDDMSNGYLSMVVVAESLRRRGIGQAIVENIVGSEDGVTWVLRAGRDGAAEFFAKLGFSASTLAMERSRRRQPVD